LVQRFGGDPIEVGELGIEQYPLTAQNEDRATDLLDRQQR